MYQLPQCEAVPLPDNQVSFRVEGQERVRWHAAARYPRPFFYPLRGPSGAALTRMGHPGAPNHDHHRSIWFAHHKVLGIDFWADRTPRESNIQQQQWLAYEDGQEARMAVRLGWYDGHDPAPLLDQELFVSVRGHEAGETWLELQSRFTPRAEQLEFQQTNFGFLAVRVAKSISAHFGGGHLTDSQGRQGEAAIFAQRAAWMDYSGPVRGTQQDQPVWEGITFFDHPSNPGYPTHWHVRNDGWMGAAATLSAPLVTRREAPVVLRYLLYAHAGPADPQRAAALADAFTALPPLGVIRSQAPHRHFEIRRT